MAFSTEQLELLRAPLDPHLAARMSPDGKNRVSYIEGYVVIEQANRILGFGQWGYEVVREERDVDPETGAGVYSAWVRVTVAGCEPVVELGDCTLLVGQGKRANAAQKSMARKGAVTDGMKRGLRHFGDQFGNSLYQKDSDIHRQIEQAEREDQQAQRQAAPRPAPPARTMTTPASGATTPPRHEGWNEGLRTASQEEVAARRLYDQVSAALALDADAAQILANDDKGPEHQTPEQLQRTLAWLTKRAEGRSAPPAAPDYGRSYEDLRTALLDAHQSGDAGEIRAARLALETAREQKQLTDDGFTMLKKLNGDKEAERALTNTPALRG